MLILDGKLRVTGFGDVFSHSNKRAVKADEQAGGGKDEIQAVIGAYLRDQPSPWFSRIIYKEDNY